MDAITKYNMCSGLSTDTVDYYFRKCINDPYANWDFYRIEYPNLLTIHYHTWDNAFQIPRYISKNKSQLKWRNRNMIFIICVLLFVLACFMLGSAEIGE